MALGDTERAFKRVSRGHQLKILMQKLSKIFKIIEQYNLKIIAQKNLMFFKSVNLWAWRIIYQKAAFFSENLLFSS